MNEKVAILGLGKLGTALGTALFVSGYSLIVWNRSDSKATSFADLGADVASSINDAIADAEIILLCLPGDTLLRQALAECDELAGKVLVQLSRGSVAQADSLADWVRARGGEYLRAIMLGEAGDMGRAEASFAVAGSEAAWRRCEAIMDCAGGASRYLGTNLAAPVALETAMAAPALMAEMGLVQGRHLLEQAGVDGGILESLAVDMTTPAMDVAGIDAGTARSISTWHALLEACITSLGPACDTSLISPVHQLLSRAIEQGYGERDASAVLDLLQQKDSSN